jgi:hypothetical protein
MGLIMWSLVLVRAYFSILERAWSANLKMVLYVLLRSLRTELDGQDQVQIIVTQALIIVVTNLLTSTNDHMIRPYVITCQLLSAFL